MLLSPSPCAPDTSSFPASGLFEALLDNGGHACLARLFSTYPLKIVPVKCDGNPRVISLYLMGHGGGLVSRDVVSIKAQLRGGSIVVLKTQGTTKVFKTQQAAQQMSTQLLDCYVHDDSFLVSVPDPTTCYRDSHLRQSQTIHLSSPSAGCLLVDSYTCGRCTEAWNASRIHSTVQIFRQGRLVLLENMDLESSSMATLAQKIGPRVGVFGTIILIGPQTQILRQHVQSLKQRLTFRNHKSAIQCPEDPVLVSVSDLSPAADGALVRFSASSVEDAFCLLAAILKPLAVELNLLPCPYADKVDPEALAARAARSGSVFEKLS